MWKTAFKKLEGFLPYPFKFFKGCLPQILFGPFLNTLPHMIFTLWKLNMCKTCLALDGLDGPSYECKVKSTKLFRVRKFAILLNDLGLNYSDISQWTQKLNWRYIRRSHGVLNVIWTLMYVQFRQCVDGVSFFTLRHVIPWGT